MAKTFNDPMLVDQWYLVNTGQRGGASRLDINVLSAWDKYSGRGVIVAVNDDGMDLTHPALAANLLVDLAFDSARGTTGQGFERAGNSHGTVVGSIVGMAGNDGIGGVGVAYDAKIVPGLIIGQGTDAAKLFLANLAAGASVSVNSWGQDPAFAENFGVTGSESDRAWLAAMVRGATEARAGLGMVIEVSGGNERANRADTALSNFTNNKITITVGAITETGEPTPYSTPGASLLVTAPGGVAVATQGTNEGYGIPSADIQGTAGYNTAEGVVGDYAYQNQGTSYSGPMVGGAAALMLQANPRLGFRDVSTILALTARKTDVANPSWVNNAASDWNLGGMHFSRDFGYGLLDVSAAVRLAESWTLAPGTMANWQSVEASSPALPSPIPDNHPDGLTVTAQLSTNVRIERMEFDLNLTATNPSQLRATITSPGGTTVTLFDQPLTRNLVEGAPNMSEPESAWPSTFTIGSTAFLGELSAGTWTLRLTDKVTGMIADYQSLTVRAWGSAETADSQYLLTDEFAASNAMLTDASGIDTLNAAAASRAVRLDLVSGRKSTIAAGELTIATGSTIENAIGGLGDDTLIGNAAANSLRGNAGNDTLNGGAGIDTAVYGGRLAGYTLSRSGSTVAVSGGSAGEGADALSDVERVRFSDMTVNLQVQSQVAAAPASDVQRIMELYVAFFNRVPDADGLSYWLSERSAGQTVNQIAENFYVNGLTYGALTGFRAGMSNDDFLNVVYRNVLGRPEGPDAGGREYWNGEFARGMARGQLVDTIVIAAHTYKRDPAYGWVADLLDNKLAVAKLFSVDWGLNYNTSEDSISHGMAIAAAVTPLDTAAAITLIGVPVGHIGLG